MPTPLGGGGIKILKNNKYNLNLLHLHNPRLVTCKFVELSSNTFALLTFVWGKNMNKIIWKCHYHTILHLCTLTHQQHMTEVSMGSNGQNTPNNLFLQYLFLKKTCRFHPQPTMLCCTLCWPRQQKPWIWVTKIYCTTYTHRFLLTRSLSTKYSYDSYCKSEYL